MEDCVKILLVSHKLLIMCAQSHVFLVPRPRRENEEVRNAAQSPDSPGIKHDRKQSEMRRSTSQGRAISYQRMYLSSRVFLACFAGLDVIFSPNQESMCFNSFPRQRKQCKLTTSFLYSFSQRVFVIKLTWKAIPLTKEQ